MSNALQITSDSFNEKGQLTNDGKYLHFLSKHQPRHKQNQIYKIELQTKKISRITFNDGEVASFAFSKRSNELIYASDTDRLKDFPSALYPSIKKNTFFDLFLATEDGQNIQKIEQTDLNHMDNSNIFPQWINDKSFLYFSINQDKITLNKAELNKNSAIITTWWEGTENQKLLQIPISLDTSSTRVAWIAKNTTDQSLILNLKSKGKINSFSVKEFAKIQSLTWNNDKEPSLILSAKKSESDRFSIWIFHQNNSCFEKILEDSSSDLKDPNISVTPVKLEMENFDQKRIMAITVNQKIKNQEVSQIFLIPEPTPKGTCDLKLSLK